MEQTYVLLFSEVLDKVHKDPKLNHKRLQFLENTIQTLRMLLKSLTMTQK